MEKNTNGEYMTEELKISDSKKRIINYRSQIIPDLIKMGISITDSPEMIKHKYNEYYEKQERAIKKDKNRKKNKAARKARKANR